jgi:hypothetical protein
MALPPLPRRSNKHFRFRRAEARGKAQSRRAPRAWRCGQFFHTPTFQRRVAMRRAGRGGAGGREGRGREKIVAVRGGGGAGWRREVASVAGAVGDPEIGARRSRSKGRGSARGARARAVVRATGEWRPWVSAAAEAARAGLAGSEALRELLVTPEVGARWSRGQRRGGARVVSAPHQACAMLPGAAAAMPCPQHPAPLVPWPALGRAAEDSRLVLLARFVRRRLWRARSAPSHTRRALPSSTVCVRSCRLGPPAVLGDLTREQLSLK